MTRKEYLRLKADLANIDDALREGHLTPEERARFEAMSVTLSRELVAPWVPMDWLRRALMFSFFSAGCYGVITGLEILLLSWPVMLIFSPRVMGENFHSVARHYANHNE